MELALLSEVPSSAIHLQYKLQTKGLKIDNIIMIKQPDMDYDILESYSETNGFKIDYVDDPNGEVCEDILRESDSQILLLMTSTIIQKEILSLVPLVLNTHSGILPQYRGVDSRRWAILEDGPIGVTVHEVDEGVDTGDIILKNILELQRGDTVGKIAERNYYQNKWQTLAEAIKKINDGSEQGTPQSTEDGKQYFWMHDKLRTVVDEILEENKHMDLR